MDNLVILIESIFNENHSHYYYQTLLENFHIKKLYIDVKNTNVSKKCIISHH